MPQQSHTSADSHQSPRLFVVSFVQKLWRFRAVCELQYFDDASQEPQSPRMPLLWLDSADSEAMPKVPVEICLFFWRRFGAPRRAFAQRVSSGADCPVGSRYRANETAISGDTGCFCGWCAGHSCWHANACEGARFSSCDVG